MSEARTRSLAQSQSNIFISGPSDRPKSRPIPQTQSKIFSPLEVQAKPMTFAREQYYRSTIDLGSEPTVYKERSTCIDYRQNSPAGKKCSQNNSTKYLIGNDRGTFFKKSVDDHFGVPEDFEPKYAKDSAFERRQKEFYNGFSPSKEEYESPIEQFSNAKERKLHDRVSVFDTNKYRKEAEDSPKENKKPPAYNPNLRKTEILSSNVFGERLMPEYKKPQIAKENDGERRKNHLYSDLFGLECTKPTDRPSEKLQPNSHFLKTSSKPTQNYDPRDQPAKILASSIELGDSPNKAPRARPRTPQNSYVPRFQESLPSSREMKQKELNTLSSDFQAPNNPELYDLELASVPISLSGPEIKELCGGVHVVSLALDIDNFTGNSKGTGRLKLRTNEARDLNRLENVFRSKGIQIKPHEENLGRKTNYSDISNVSWHHPYDYRRTTTPCGAKESKMKNLESSVFETQHKWVDRRVESLDGELNAQMQWKNTKNAARPYY